ncbi:MAG TPA: ABC transporter permease [Acholeplasmataceae bacterium]|nr:ABC transporter permease [Acholeplasmataceae bacterium]
MIVFKLYWKIFLKNITSVIIYFGIFILITLITMQSNTGDQFSFQIVKTEVAFVDEDNTDLTRGLKDYLEKYVTFKNIDKDKVEDALFYQDISMYIEIPAGYTESLTEEESLTIKTRSIPTAAGTQIIKRALNKYSHLAFVYLNNDLQTDNLVSTLQEKLDQEAKIDHLDMEKKDYSQSQYFYNYMAYVVIALVISVISSIMLAFKPLEIKRRNLLSSISNRKFNLILFFSNFLLGITFLGFLIVLSMILYPSQMLTKNGLFLILNAFVFSLPIIALAYLIVTLFDSRNVINALGTVFSLGFSFITGVFIPQFLLDEKILLFARIIPSFYYVQNNDRIINLSDFNFQSLKGIFNNFLIQIAFAFIFVVITIFIAKKRQTQES